MVCDLSTVAVHKFREKCGCAGGDVLGTLSLWSVDPNPIGFSGNGDLAGAHYELLCTSVRAASCTTQSMPCSAAFQSVAPLMSLLSNRGALVCRFSELACRTARWTTIPVSISPGHNAELMKPFAPVRSTRKGAKFTIPLSLAKLTSDPGFTQVVGGLACGC